MGMGYYRNGEDTGTELEESAHSGGRCGAAMIYTRNLTANSIANHAA